MVEIYENVGIYETEKQGNPQGKLRQYNGPLIPRFRKVRGLW